MPFRWCNWAMNLKNFKPNLLSFTAGKIVKVVRNTNDVQIASTPARQILLLPRLGPISPKCALFVHSHRSKDFIKAMSPLY